MSQSLINAFHHVLTHHSVGFSSLIKEETNRPKYKSLLQHPFIQLHEKLQSRSIVAEFVGKSNILKDYRSFTNSDEILVDILESMSNNGMGFTQDEPGPQPVW